MERRFKMYSKKLAFSLIELLISLIVISCITAAFTPIITKKFSSGVFGGGGSSNGWSDECKDISPSCKLCYKDNCIMCSIESCPSGQYRNLAKCKCIDCSIDYGTDCLTCSSDGCLSCKDGKYPNGNTCTNCDTKYPNCATCDETKCKTCKTNYKLDNGKCVPDCTKFFNENCTTCDELTCKTCKPNYDLVGNDCIANCPTKFGSTCTSCTASACTGCISGYKLSGNTCVPDCNALFGANCTSCTASACATCTGGYELSSNPSQNPACKSSPYMAVGNLMVTKYNIGDHPDLTIPYSTLTVSAGNNYDSNDTPICWKGQTGMPGSCDSAYGDYSGCNRTVCNYWAAEDICSKLKIGSRPWRLPSLNEASKFAAYSIGKGAGGLQLCDAYSGYSSTQCAYNWGCSRSGVCSVFSIWTTGASSLGLTTYSLFKGDWGEDYGENEFYAKSVRCVSDI